jgi:VWFA-related protein
MKTIANNLALLSLALSFSAQQQPKIAVDVKTVTVLATVRDKHNKPISNLSKNDFTLLEDGHPQTIDYFAAETDLPLRLGLLVDTSLSQRRLLDEERSASYSFLDRLLRPDKDLAFIIHFDSQVELLQEFTPSRPKLQAALQQLQTPELDRDRGSQGGNGGNDGGQGGSGRRGGRGRGGAGTLLYDAVYLASDELMSKQSGRKAVIILSDGDDRGSKETLATAIETAQRADTVVYAILFKDDEAFGNRGFGGRGGMGGGRGGRGGYPRENRPDGKKILERIAKETGGRLFEVSKKETAEKIYAQIEDDLRHQYSLAYTPPKDTQPGYHKIQLTTTNKDLIVQSRDGYYSTASAQPAR